MSSHRQHGIQYVIWGDHVGILNVDVFFLQGCSTIFNSNPLQQQQQLFNSNPQQQQQHINPLS
jgi:hypothetical protein